MKNNDTWIWAAKDRNYEQKLKRITSKDSKLNSYHAAAFSSITVLRLASGQVMASGFSPLEAEVSHLKLTLATDVTKLDVGTKVGNLQTKLETVRKVQLLFDARFSRQIPGLSAWNRRAVMTSEHQLQSCLLCLMTGSSGMWNGICRISSQRLDRHARSPRECASAVALWKAQAENLTRL